MSIKDNVKRLIAEIHDKNIYLVAVTKTRSSHEIKEAIEAGISIIGENKIQEAEKKYNLLKEYLREEGIKFHFIGHLQKNKVRKAVEMFDIIESVDSLELAKEIDKKARDHIKIQSIFIEVNIGEESQKSGMLSSDINSIVGEISKLKNLNLCGLMCIPPYFEDSKKSRPFFKHMKNIFDVLNLEYLSMGMTNDYKIAIEEGSNLIRIGTGIFGERR